VEAGNLDEIIYERRTAICGYAAHGLRSLPIPRRTLARPPLRINNVWKSGSATPGGSAEGTERGSTSDVAA